MVHEKKPGPFFLLPSVVRLELCIGDSAKFRFVGRRFHPVGVADDMDQSVAGVDLVAEHLPEIPGFRAEEILRHGREAISLRIADTRSRISPNSCGTQEMATRGVGSSIKFRHRISSPSEWECQGNDLVRDDPQPYPADLAISFTARKSAAETHFAGDRQRAPASSACINSLPQLS